MLISSIRCQHLILDAQVCSIIYSWAHKTTTDTSKKRTEQWECEQRRSSSMASIVGSSKKFCSCKNRCPNTSCFCSRIPPNGSSILLTTRLLSKIGYGSSSPPQRNSPLSATQQKSWVGRTRLRCQRRKST